MRLRFVPTITLCFNPRTRVGCDFLMRRSRLLISGFNPRTRVGCDSPPTNRIFAAQEFQSTHPRGVRLAALLGLSIRVTVSIHAPAWGATTSIWQARNSRPVSIHAPAWGATCRHVRQRACLRVSIHAPAWGATPAQPAAGTTAGRFQSTHPRGVRLALIMGLASINKFQSTHPRGVRLLHAEGHIRDGPVSIHAPAWGATGVVRARQHHLPVSIHAPAWGATQDAKTSKRTQAFQSTHPRGVRRYGYVPVRPRMPVSIHAPAWGATSARKDSRLPPSVSIHAPAWGATFELPFDVGIIGKFQSTHPRGVRPVCGIVVSKRTTFQSTHPRGVRHATTLRPPARGRSFNPRTRVGCDIMIVRT